MWRLKIPYVIARGLAALNKKNRPVLDPVIKLFNNIDINSTHMHKRSYFLLTSFLFIAVLVKAQRAPVMPVFADAEKQVLLALTEVPAAANESKGGVLPRTVENGRLKLVSSRDWTSGFFPGVLWYLFENSADTQWKRQAEAFTALVEREKTNGDTHDMGFKINCSFGNGYRLTGNPAYREVILQAAATLATRFNSTAGVIKSWDNRKEWAYPVIIDNMMNLELLFMATRLSGDSSYYRMAVTHAQTTLKNHFRPDNSSYHVLDYDTTTGAVTQKTTHQGFSNESAWARGQAWGLYGYTMCYRETGEKAFLQQAERIARYLLDHPALPSDGVPYWDFDAPGLESQPRDASAAAIMCSALFELSDLSEQKRQKVLYRNAAQKQLKNLIEHYRSPLGENKGFLLVHCTGHKPANSEIDVPLIYADYYFLEALLRSKQHGKKRKALSGKL